VPRVSPKITPMDREKERRRTQSRNTSTALRISAIGSSVASRRRGGVECSGVTKNSGALNKYPSRALPPFSRPSLPFRSLPFPYPPTHPSLPLHVLPLPMRKRVYAGKCIYSGVTRNSGPLNKYPSRALPFLPLSSLPLPPHPFFYPPTLPLPIPPFPFTHLPFLSSLFATLSFPSPPFFPFNNG